MHSIDGTSYRGFQGRVPISPECPESQSILGTGGNPTIHSDSLAPTLEAIFSQDCSSPCRGKVWPPACLTHSYSLPKAWDPSVSLHLTCFSH